MVSSEGKFSNLSSEERSSLAGLGRDTLSRLRDKQKAGICRDRVEELREEHRREIEKIIAAGEEDKSRELSLLSEELTKHYKYHIDQLEQKLQLFRETDDVTGSDGSELSRYKSHIEHTASIQVQQYYQQCKEEVEKMEEEINLLIEEKEQGIEDAAVLRRELQTSREELESLMQRESESSRESEWEVERVRFLQRLQEADTKVGGLERLLEARLGACELLTVERDEAREILENREREKMALSRHFTEQVEQLERERAQLSETVRRRDNELLEFSTNLSELRELLERKENEKKQLTQEFLRNRSATQECENIKSELTSLSAEKQDLIAELSAERSAVGRLGGDLEGLESIITQLRQENTVLEARIESTTKLNGELCGKKSELDKQLAAVLYKYSAVERQLQTRDGEARAQREERDKEGVRIRELEQLLVIAGEDKTDLSLRLSEAECHTSEANSINVSIRAELETVRREAQERCTENERLMAELESLNRDYLAVQSDRDNLSTKVNEYAYQLQDRDELDNIKSAGNQLLPQINAATEIGAIRSENAGASAHLRAMKEEMLFLRSREDERDRLNVSVRELKQKLQADNIALSNKLTTRS